MATDTRPAPSQFALLRQRRFAPFFWTQFLGAANDNVFKFALTLLVTYQLQAHWLAPEHAGLAIGALFILPYVLASATAGQLADRFERRWLIVRLKDAEVAIMLVAALGFYLHQVGLLLACVALTGLQSALFGPVKYAYLPQHLDEGELTGGNGLVEAGTFAAILLGHLVGGLLVAHGPAAGQTVGLACIGLALLGRWTAGRVPLSPAAAPTLAIDPNPVRETWRNLRELAQQVVVFRSVLGISWLWFYGAVFLTLFPAFARDVLRGDAAVASLLIVAFTLGIGAGSLACERLSRRHVDIGLVPIGAAGMTLFAVDLVFAVAALEPAGAPGALQSPGEFLRVPGHWRVLVDLVLLSAAAGLFSVPMYALVQLRTPAERRARMIAANNIVNALFMIASAVAAGALLAAGWTIPEIFLAVAIANALVAAYIVLLVPEYLLRFLAWLATHLVYRFRVQGEAHIPTHGPALLACNHVSFVDAVLLLAASPRPIRFVMDHRIFAAPVLGGLFRLAGAIPVAARREDPATYEAAFERAAAVLRDGELLAIFPEGAITPDGQLHPFKGGVMKILARARADGLAPPVVPMALANLWGSFFSRVDGRAMSRPFRRGLFNRVVLAIGAPLDPADVTAEGLHRKVADLLAASTTGRTAA